ncbi:hypothetical protein P8A21_34835 [Streptomyces poriferorum]|uniref:hypothetical protein n=1 Tax=Streptomyces poriferorum TaxID=2798799 RepID=UPI00273F24BD|nr:hypothetical protein [Streptomyces sp. Alt1]WLQ53628.1 hypothetical protein P8A21_34835 [Streptomyces sp. Alt1]
MPWQTTSAPPRHWSDIRNGVLAPETVRCLRITLTAPGDTVWAVNEIRLHADRPGAAATLRAEQAGDIRGVTRATPPRVSWDQATASASARSGSERVRTGGPSASRLRAGA